MQELLALRFVVNGAPLQVVLDDVLRWAVPRSGAELMTASTEERATHSSVVEGRELHATTWPAEAEEQIGPAAEVVLVHPDSAVDRLAWRTQVDLIADGGDVQVTVRLAREATSFLVQPAHYSRRTPGLVRDLVSAYDCHAGGVALTDRAVDVGSPQLDDLTRVIHSTDRVLPVVLLTRSTRDPDLIATRLLGLAHVYVVRSMAVDKLPDVAGLDIDFDPQGAMLIWPRPLPEGGFDRWYARSDCRSAGRFADRVYEMLAGLASVSVPRDRRFAQLRDADARRRLALAAAEGSDAKTYRELAEGYMRDAEEAQAQVSDLAQQVARLSGAVAAKTASWGRGSQESARVAPDGLVVDPLHLDVCDWKRFVRYAQDLADDALVIQPGVLEALRKCPYPNPQRMWEHLVRLKHLADDYRSADSISGRLKEHALQQHGIEIALKDASITATTVYDGRTLDTVPHVKVDDVKKANECGRIYFALDKVGQCLVVDHIGLHR